MTDHPFAETMVDMASATRKSHDFLDAKVVSLLPTGS